MDTTALPPERSADAVDVLCEAFFDYPVMRWVIGSRGDEYPRHLHTLVEFLVAARFLRNESVIGVAQVT